MTIDDATVDAERRAATSIPELPSSLATWDRYRLEESLGRGGMGQVVRAFDPTLGRHVALKFLHGDNPTMVERFLAEARSQARVEHDRVCKIYEVGEVDGKPYIAMQLIKGRPLDAAAADMTTEEKLLVMAHVADGLHAAHRVGLVHRDVKPSNVMVERSERGEWRPYVMDFGLARESDRPDLTVPGAVLGTPHFMAPEQARGDTASVDRRTDVYGLGSTLYAVAVGRPPFSGTSFAELLPQIVGDAPPSLRKFERSVPSEVDAIAQRALRKRPDERYGSAREFAADLRRYLDGEPIRARDTTWWYRTRLWAARHRGLVALGTAAVIALGAAVAWGIDVQRRGAERSRIAESFGREVERIDSVARYTSMSPIHDARPSRGRIRNQMDGIRHRMAELGPLAEPSGHYALGRGHLALGEYGDALRELRAARSLGHDSPDLSYALGQTLGELFRQEVSMAATIPSRSDRERAIAAADSTFRRPATAALEDAVSRGSFDVAGYVDALLSHYSGDHDAAIRTAEAVSAGRPWAFEAHRLIGHAQSSLMEAAADSGDTETASSRFDAAMEAFTRAVEIAPSDIASRRAMVELVRERVGNELDDGGASIDEWVDEGERLIELGLLVRPDDVDLLVTRSRLLRAAAIETDHEGGEARALYRDAIVAAKQAVDTEERPGFALRALAEATADDATHRRSLGEDPTTGYADAIRCFDEARKLAPDDIRLFNQIGQLRKSMALHRIERGQDGSEDLQASINAYRSGLAIDDERYDLLHNLAVVYYTQAKQWTDVESGMAALDSADAAFEAAAELHPRSLAIHYNAGRALALRASIAYDSGTDADGETDRAIAAFRRAIAVRPTSSYAATIWDAAGSAYFDRATSPVVDAPASAAAYDSATACYDRALAVSSTYHWALSNLGGLLVRRPAGSGDAAAVEARVRRAFGLLRQAIAQNPQSCLSYVNLAIGHRRLAESGSVPFDAALAAATDSLDVAIECNPRLESAYLEYGHIARTRANVVGIGERMAWIDEAIGHYRSTLDMLPNFLDAARSLADATVFRTEIARTEGDAARSRAEAEDAMRRVRLIAPDSSVDAFRERLDQAMARVARQESDE